MCARNNTCTRMHARACAGARAHAHARTDVATHRAWWELCKGTPHGLSPLAGWWRTHTLIRPTQPYAERARVLGVIADGVLGVLAYGYGPLAMEGVLGVLPCG